MENVENEINFLWKLINYTPKDLVNIYTTQKMSLERLSKLSEKFLGDLIPETEIEIIEALTSISKGEQPGNLKYPKYDLPIKKANSSILEVK